MSGVSSFAGSILPNVFLVFKRFPLAVLTAGLLTILMVAFDKALNLTPNFYFGLMSLFFVFVGAVFVTEQRNEASWYGFVVSLIIGSVIVGLYYFADFVGLRHMMLAVATLLGASSVVYFFSPKNNRAYWLFNHEFWFTLVIAIIGGMIIAGLFSLLFAVYGALFNTRVDGDLYKYTFQICSFFITPVFWLSMLPQEYEAEVEETEPTELMSKVTGLFVKYVFVPFFFMFVLLFHGLAVKVGLSGVFPKGQIGWYGLAVIILGIGTYLMAFPTRNVGGALVRFFHKYWFLFLIIPMALLFVAHSIRVAEYGMTPKRYFLFAFFFWSLALILYGLYIQIKGREFDLRVILFLATVILGVSSFGPWGAETVSIYSQKQKLVSVLQKADVLENGVIKKAFNTSTDEARKAKRKIRNLLRFFRKEQRADYLRVLLSEEERPAKGAHLNYFERRKSSWNNPIIAKIDEKLGFRKNVAVGAKLNSRSFYASGPYSLAIPSKGMVFGPITLSKSRSALNYHRDQIVQLGGRDVRLSFQIKEQELIVLKGQGEVTEAIGRFSLQEIYKMASGQVNENLKKKKRKNLKSFVVDGLPTSAEKLRLYVMNFNYSEDKETSEYKAMTYIKFSLHVEKAATVLAQ